MIKQIFTYFLFLIIHVEADINIHIEVDRIINCQLLTASLTLVTAEVVPDKLVSDLTVNACPIFDQYGNLTKSFLKK